MASRAAIEEQIRLLNEQLVASTAYDPEFTPMELVRWNPDLIGTVLHCEHTPKKELRPINFWNFTGVFAEVFGIINETSMIKSMHKRIHKPNAISKSNIHDPDISGFRKCCRIVYNEEVADDFKLLTTFKILLNLDVEDACKALNLINYKIDAPDSSGYKCVHMQLVPDDKCILDHIYVSSIITLPYSGNPQVVHKYPLSHLYKKWKQEKDARTPAEPEDPHTKP